MRIREEWHEGYKTDLTRILVDLSDGGKIQLYLQDIWTAAIMYSCDMCIHYYKSGAYYGISQETIDDITYNVCYILTSIVPEFEESQYKQVFDGVHELVDKQNIELYNILQEQIDQYYTSFLKE